LLGDCAQNDREKQSEKRLAGSLTQSTEFGDGPGESGVILVAKQRRKPLRSFISQHRLVGAAANCIGPAVNCAGMLPHGVNHLLRPARLYCEAGELSEKQRNRNLRDALRVFGVEIERGRYPFDSVRGQVLHDHPDQIDSHLFLLSQ
jgi:hypothetical protein